MRLWSLGFGSSLSPPVTDAGNGTTGTRSRASGAMSGSDLEVSAMVTNNVTKTGAGEIVNAWASSGLKMGIGMAVTMTRSSEPETWANVETKNVAI